MGLTKQHILRLLLRGIRVFILIPFCMAGSIISAQTIVTQKQPKQDKGISISAALVVPLSEFYSTHFLGIATEIAPSENSVILLKRPNIEFTYNGGVAYYMGKKETVSSYPYKYPGFLFIHAFAGAGYIPAKNLDIRLTAGPAVGIYNGTTRFNFGSKLDINYHFNNTIAVGPGINMMKEFGATSLWSASIKATIVL